MKSIVYLSFCLLVGIMFASLWQASRPGVATAVSEHSPPISTGSSPGESTDQTNGHTADQTTLYFPIVLKIPAYVTNLGYDMVHFMNGDSGILYEVQHSIGSQARHQTQMEAFRFYHTKGNEFHAEWEELWYDNAFIFRGTDTSPGNNQYYTLRSGNKYGSAWSPRHWKVGDIFQRDPIVTFYDKTNCLPQTSGLQITWLKFEAYHPQYSFPSGITLNHVVQLAWLLHPTAAPLERYYYAMGYGLVGWWSNDRGMSHVSHIYAPGERLDNKRETITCLNQSGTSPTGLPAPAQYAK